MLESLQQCVRISIVFVILQYLNVLIQAQNEICATPECQNLASTYLNNMNEKINPCHDFYGYACDRWAVVHKEPDYIDLWRTEEMLLENTYLKVQALLEDYSRKHPKPKVEHAKALYRACMKLPYMQKFDLINVREIVNKIGNWPMISPKNAKLPANLRWWQIDNAYLKITGESALYDIGLVAHERRNHEIQTAVKRLTSPYGMLRRTEFWSRKGKQRSNYKNFLVKVIKSISTQKQPFFGGTINSDVSDVMQFRDDLYKVIQKEDVGVPFEGSIGKVQEWYNKRVYTNTSAQVDWLEVIRHLHKDGRDAHDKPIQSSTVIQIDEDYIPALGRLMAKISEKVIINHIHLYFAERHLQLTPNMLEDLDKSYSLIDGHLNGYKRTIPKKSRACIDNNSMMKTIGLLFEDTVLPEEAKRKMKTFINEAKELMKEQITGSPWMDQMAKKVSLDKLLSLVEVIGHSESYDSNFPSAKWDPFDIDPLEPEASYVQQTNRLYIGAAYLQPPIFNLRSPYVIDYATTVSMIGHELQHLFDQENLYFYRNKTVYSWPKEMHTELLKRAKCFKTQYNKYRSLYLKKYQISQWDLDKLPNTVDEDIADVRGLKLAYIGYRRQILNHKGICAVLPGFDKIGCEKLFFIAFANTFCGTNTPQGEKYALLLDSHSLPRIRVNAAVANMKEFSAAFNCAPNDPLNLKTRCDVWK